MKRVMIDIDRVLKDPRVKAKIKGKVGLTDEEADRAIAVLEELSRAMPRTA